MAIEFPFNDRTPVPPFSIPPEDNLLRSKMDAGVIIQRKRYTKARREFTIRWQGTDEDFDKAEEFYYNTLDGGVASFHLIVRNILGKIIFNGNVLLTKPYVPTYNGIGTWEFEYAFVEKVDQ